MILAVMNGVRVLLRLLADFVAFLWLLLRPRGSLPAENLLLRKQLAMYRQRGRKPCRPDTQSRGSLVVLSKLFDWKDTLVVIQPQTLVRWYRQRFRLLWRWKSRACPAWGNFGGVFFTQMGIRRSIHDCETVLFIKILGPISTSSSSLFPPPGTQDVGVK